MNISREAVLKMLRERAETPGSIEEQRWLAYAITEIEKLPEAPGMDSAWRKAMEENWSGGPKCQAWLPTADGKRQCGNRATQKIRVPRDTEDNPFASNEPSKYLFQMSMGVCDHCAKANKRWTDDGRCFITD